MSDQYLPIVRQMSSMLFAFKSRNSSDMCFLVSRSRLDFLDVAKIEDSKKCRPWDTCCVGSDGDVIPLPDGCYCADHIPESQKRARKLPKLLVWVFILCQLGLLFSICNSNNQSLKLQYDLESVQNWKFCKMSLFLARSRFEYRAS